MSKENIDRLRASLEVFNSTGEIVVDDLAPDFELHQASSIVDTAGVFHGRHALRDSLRELRGSFEELSFEAEKVIEAPGGEIVVLIHARGRGRGSGLEIDNHIAWVWTFRGDQAVRLVVYEEQAEALEAVGLSDG
jgi:ketosteroid isomerase-like protein